MAIVDGITGAFISSCPRLPCHSRGKDACISRFPPRFHAIAGDNDKSSIPQPVMTEEIVPEISHQQQHEKTYGNGVTQIKRKLVRCSGCRRRNCFIQRRFDQKHISIEMNATSPIVPISPTSCPYRLWDSIGLPVAGRHAPGPIPVSGFRPQSIKPFCNPSSLPSPDCLAFSGPTSGLMIVSKRFCKESGNARKMMGAAEIANEKPMNRCLLRHSKIDHQTSIPINDDREPVSMMQPHDKQT